MGLLIPEYIGAGTGCVVGGIAGAAVGGPAGAIGGCGAGAVEGAVAVAPEAVATGLITGGATYVWERYVASEDRRKALARCAKLPE